MLTKIFKIRNRNWVLPNSLIVFMKMIILFFTYDLFLHFNWLLGSTDITLENHWPLLNKQIPVASSLVAYFKELPMWVVACLQINASKLECLPYSFQGGLIYEAIVCFLWFGMAKYGYHEPPIVLSSSEGWLPTSLRSSQNSPSHEVNFSYFTETVNKY